MVLTSSTGDSDRYSPKIPLAHGGEAASLPPMSADYLPFLVQAVLALVIVGGVIFLSQFLGQRFKPNKIKDTAYECGVQADDISHTRFSVKFYVTAMLFILFDIEVVFLIPWTFVYRDFLANHIAILAPMLFFPATISKAPRTSAIRPLF